MTEYNLTPQQKEWFFVRSSYSLVDDGVYRPGMTRNVVQGPNGQSGVLYRMSGSDHFVLITDDPELMRSMRGMDISPQRGGMESSLGALMGAQPGYQLTADQYRNLMERLGSDYGQSRDGGITYLVPGKDENERRIRGQSAIRNGGVGAAATVRQQINEFRPNVAMGYVIITQDPRIVAELQRMGVSVTEQKKETAKRP
jgi:hypothetical protein